MTSTDFNDDFPPNDEQESEMARAAPCGVCIAKASNYPILDFKRLENIYLIPPPLCFNLHAVSRPFQILQHKMGGKECEPENLIHNRIHQSYKTQIIRSQNIFNAQME